MRRNIESITQVLRPLFEQHGISRAVVFGSYAKGTATEKSDIDLFIDSGLRGLKFAGFIDAVQQALGIRADVFNDRYINKGSVIEQEISQTGILIYEK